MGDIVDIERRRKRRRRRNKGFTKKKILALLIVLLVIGLGVFINGPMFRVTQLEVVGNERLSDEEILEDLGIEEGTNLIYYMIRHWNQDPKVSPLLRSVDIYVSWPHTVQVTVEEKRTMGLIPYMGMYLCIDAAGCVLDSVHDKEDAPLITGISVESFSLGAVVDTRDEMRFQIILEALQILEKYELMKTVDEIQVSSSDAIHLIAGTLDASLGNSDDLDQKIAAMAAVLDQEGMLNGILHLERPDEQIYLEPK